MLALQLVKDFHVKYKIPIVEDPSVVPIERVVLRMTLLNEEVRELIEADELGQIDEIAKEASDVLYVLLGTALEFGYRKYFEGKRLFSAQKFTNKAVCLQDLIDKKAQFQVDWSRENLAELLNVLTNYLTIMGLKTTFSKIIQEVHRSNMSKGTNGQPLIRADGKILKGADFKLADLSFLNKSCKS
jgi:predicted HAD superfamily Cof-like phosphohydrolase